ncbi:Protein of unknown function [Cotesia congregata]|uniref:Uncharacterized protein n=1 Tax=Cotesia congregata TaxID=51543 RepID=A0A8J2MRJ4_COTCN|nr:Protein of unknown function [Cotesia congregata]
MVFQFRIETVSPKNDILAPQNTKTTPPATPKTYTWKKKFKIKSFKGPFGWRGSSGAANALFRIETVSPKNDILAPQNTKTTPPATPKTYTWKKQFKIKSFRGPFEAGYFL